ncbi:MAG: hypothetical protein M3P40_07185 [Actinomycetota bacterium]|nr:hypothetical protein [Actinomycetota bacterium]
MRQVAMELYLRGELTGVEELFGFVASASLLGEPAAETTRARAAYCGALDYVRSRAEAGKWR